MKTFKSSIYSVKKIPATTQVPEEVIKRLEMLGIDWRVLINKTLNEAAKHYVCPCCGGLLKPKAKP